MKCSLEKIVNLGLPTLTQPNAGWRVPTRAPSQTGEGAGLPAV